MFVLVMEGREICHLATAQIEHDVRLAVTRTSLKNKVNQSYLNTMIEAKRSVNVNVNVNVKSYDPLCTPIRNLSTM
jgi:hypothetical protein